MDSAQPRGIVAIQDGNESATLLHPAVYVLSRLLEGIRLSWRIYQGGGNEPVPDVKGASGFEDLGRYLRPAQSSWPDAEESNERSPLAIYARVHGARVRGCPVLPHATAPCVHGQPSSEGKHIFDYCTWLSH